MGCLEAICRSCGADASWIRVLVARVISPLLRHGDVDGEERSVLGEEFGVTPIVVSSARPSRPDSPSYERRPLQRHRMSSQKPCKEP